MPDGRPPLTLGPGGSPPGPVAMAAPGGLALVVAMIAVVRMAVSRDMSQSADVVLWGFEMAAAITAAGAGAVICTRDRSSGVGWVLQASGLALAVGTLTDTAATLPDAWQPFGDATAGTQLWTNLLGRALLLSAAVVALPDRALPGRSGRGPVTGLVAGTTVAVTAALVVRDHAGLGGTNFGFGNRAWIEAAGDVPPIVVAGLVIVLIGALVLLALRRRGDEPTVFQVLGWGLVAAAVPAAVPAIAARLPGSTAEILTILTLPLLPTVAVVAAIRAATWTVARVVNRTLLWGLLSLGIALAQAVALGAAATAGGRVGFATSVVVTAAVALSLPAVRARLQPLIDRVTYGARRDPYDALRRVGRQLEAATGPEASLHELALSIQAAYACAVRVRVKGNDGRDLAAEAGAMDAGAIPHRWPLLHNGIEVGELVVASPAAAPLRQADLTALETVARHAAIVAAGVRTAFELRRSQTELVTAVEDERRRLQRELHDGLGPTLAGVALGIRAARNQLTATPGDTVPLLDVLATEVEASVEDVRRIVHDLRPATLDQLGLVGAIRAYADRCSSQDLTVSVSVDGELPILNAATEVSAYRIACEALTNVVRHAGASTCAVSVRATDHAVAIEVVDDGVGLAAGAGAGIGVTSMRDRTVALGGRLLVEVGDGGGTRLVATLPVEARGA